MIESAISAFGGASLALVVLDFLARKWPSHNLSKELEEHRSLLARRNASHQTRLSALQIKRTEVISEVFSYLVEAHICAKNLIPHKKHPLPPKREATAGRELVKALSAFDRAYAKQRIWLPKNICESLDSLKQKLSWETTFFLLLRYMDSQRSLPEGWKEELQDKTWDNFHTEIPKTLEVIEEEFRKVIGSYET